MQSFLHPSILQRPFLSRLLVAIAAAAPVFVAPVFAGAAETETLTNAKSSEVMASDHAVVQAMLRIPDSNMDQFSDQGESVRRYLTGIAATDPNEFVRIASQLRVRGIEDSLLDIASSDKDSGAAIRAARLMMGRGHRDALVARMTSGSDQQKLALIQSIAAIDSTEAAQMVLPIMLDDSRSNQMRSAAAQALGKNWHGEQELLKLARANTIPDSLRFDVSNALLGSWTKEIAAEAKTLKSLKLMEAAGSQQPLPPINALVRNRGNLKRGKKVYFGNGTCSKCHQIGEEGKNVGPNLSEIGSKLSREDMYVAILNPSAAISHNFETFAALTVDGVVVNGLLVGETDEEISIKNAEGVVKTIATDDIETLKKQEVSLMPADLQKGMSQQELVDLVEYLSMLKKPDEARFDANASIQKGEPSRAPADAITGFEIADGLAVGLFAYEPMMYSPTAIDVDHRGRVWVCESVNYRHFRNPDNKVRTEGDRILVMTDTDGDGAADKSTVFYQGNDINSPHGVCVLGDSVLVSAGENVFRFQDTDGDDVADEKNVLFTGIGGVEHDHGIHSFMPGPDGKLYFNFGNEGHQIRDAAGNPIVDKAGNEVNDKRQPYQQGMVFRCDLDGSHFETLGWNFRNNWEVAVDSYGAMWQSDNDDDGNRGTRINFVLEYGNYGYRDELTGDYWNARRISDEGDIPLRHWHLNDPGVVPNLLQTGAGSPTGMMVYEGDLLPETFRGQMIHTDPGPNVVRSYPAQPDGAGYRADIVNLIKGVQDQWFRPVDAVAAPDGSVMVADWYDPGVGGHRMGDTERGRLFRITVPGHETYQFDLPDFSTVDGALAALESPNVETRFLAGQALRKMATESNPDVADWLGSASDPIQRARRMWVLAKIDATAADAIEASLKDDDLNIRLAAIRAARQTEAVDTLGMIEAHADDPSPQIRRELLVALAEIDSPQVPSLWTRLASHHDGNDRWYLESLGVAARGRWDTIFPVWMASAGDQWNSSAGRDIVWRARTPMACGPLAELIRDTDDPIKQRRYFRALDFLQGSEKDAALRSIVKGDTKLSQR